MEDIILVGFGGHGKSVADCIERQKEYRIIGYTDMQEHDAPYKYLGTDEVLQEYYAKGIRNAAVCVGYLGKGTLREKLYDRLIKIGYTLPVIKDPSSVISESAVIGEGTFIGKSAVVNAETRVGKMCIINTQAVVEHECCVGDFVHVAVGAVLCGQVCVGDGAFVGANATVIQCMNIAERGIVPAGYVIRENDMNKMKKLEHGETVRKLV